MSRTTLFLVVATVGIAAAGVGGASAMDGSTDDPRTVADPRTVPAQGLELVGTFTGTPGNVAVTPQGRVILSKHPFGAPNVRVVELLPDGSTPPFPNAAWAGPVDERGVGIHSIIGINSDAEGIVWMVDMGNLTEPGGIPPKIIAWDSVADRLHRVIHIPPPASNPRSFLQDLAVDTTHQAIYLADCGIGQGFEDAEPALVVVDLTTGTSRRVLANASVLQPEPDAAMVIDGREVASIGADGERIVPRIGVNPVTIDVAHEWVVFGSMHGRTLWRIRSADLRDASLSDVDLVARVERLGAKGVSDGITMDDAGNVYVTDVNRNGIGVLQVGRGYRLLLEDDERLSWPDGMSVGPDGNIYVVVNQLHRHAALSEGEDRTTPPFTLLRFRPLAPASVGR